MALITVTATAAVAIAGYDLLTNNILKTVNYPRRVRRMGFSGSNAVGDCQVRLLAGGDQIANMFNGKLLPLHADSDMFNVHGAVRANTPLAAQMVTGASTSAVYLAVETDP
jgi:hypothetical protein|tara:strand:- start:1439 stop:1771 length:333 start_codon:yes stop_codon:yes gene_type:complete